MSDDESDQQSTARQPSPPASALSGDAIHEATQEMESGQKADDALGEQASNPAKSSRFQRFMHKHFPEATAHDRWTLVFTAVIALSTFFYMLFAGWTLWEIHSGSADTHKLALAAGQQAIHTETIAQAASDISDAAGNFSSSTEKIGEDTRRAVDELRRTADDSERGINEASKNAQQALRISERPYINVEDARFDPSLEQNHDPATVKFAFHNAGKTPALKGWFDVDVFIDTEKVAQLPRGFPSEITIPSDRGVAVSLNVWFKHPGDFEGVSDGTKKLSLKGKIRYTDIFQEWHPTTFCIVYDGKRKEWVFCPGNDVK